MFNENSVDLYTQKKGTAVGSAMVYAPEHLHKIRMTNAVELLARHIPPQVTVLDIGCGYGALLDYLGPEQYRWYKGVDPTPHLIDEAKLRYGNNPKVDFLVSDLQQLTKTFEQAEYVFCLGVAAHLLPEQDCLNQFAGMLASRATRGVIVEFQDPEKYNGKFSAWSKAQVETAFGRRVSKAYSVEAPGDSTYCVCFSLQ